MAVNVAKKEKGQKTQLRTGAEFLEALNDGRRVVIGGERIDNVATHPKTAAYAQQVARYYDMHHDPELQEVLTYVDDDGVRRSMNGFLPRDRDQLVAKRKFHDTVLRQLHFGQFGRTPDANTLVYLTFRDDPEPWAENSIDTEGKVLAENSVNFWNLITENDLNAAPAAVDSQPNRSKGEAYQTSPDLRVIERNDDGIVVRGLKAVATGTVWSDRTVVGNMYRPGLLPEQIAFFHVPTNVEGLTIVAREPVHYPDSGNPDHPLASLGDELDNILIFDDVFVPWSDVFHLGNEDHAKLYPQRLFDFLHWQDLIRQVAKAELMLGLAILISDAIGTIEIPAIQMRLTDMVRFREALQSHLLASEYQGFISPGGFYRPNNRYYDFGRAHYLEFAPKYMHELLDLVGRGSVIQPTDADWNDSELHEWLKPLMAGSTSEDERLRMLRVVRDIVQSEWGRRNAMFDNFNGTPITAVRLLTMRRTEYQPDGPLTVLAREACGLPLAEGQVSQRDEIAEYAKAIDARTV